MTTISLTISSQWMHVLPKIRRIFLYFVMGIAIGFGYAKVTHIALMFGLVNAITITFLVGLFEVFLDRTTIGFRVRNSHFVVYSLFISVTWTLLIVASLEGVTHFLAGFEIDMGDPLRHQAKRALLTDIVAAVFFVYSVHALDRIKSLVGSKNLTRLLLGRYRRPLHEYRTFVFIDIVNSTGITQKLGARKAQALFTEIFADIDELINRFGGEPHRYIGDEIVVTWPLDKAENTIEAIEAIALNIQSKAEYFVEQYGIVPRFRAGVHGGEIVSGNVGSDRKREIVYFGDTINTVARLTALTSKLGVDVLVSEQLIERLRTTSLTLTPLGEFELKGLSEPLGVYGIVMPGWGQDNS